MCGSILESLMGTTHGADELRLCPHGLACQAGAWGRYIGFCIGYGHIWPKIICGLIWNNMLRGALVHALVVLHNAWPTGHEDAGPATFKSSPLRAFKIWYKKPPTCTGSYAYHRNLNLDFDAPWSCYTSEVPCTRTVPRQESVRLYLWWIHPAFRNRGTAYNSRSFA
jgi:hypothetical protein